MAISRLLAAVLLVAFLLAGCASRDAPAPTHPSTTDPGLVPVDGGGANTAGNATGTGGPKPSAATMNLSKDPVDIQDGGDLTQGISKDWNWHVAPGFKVFTVELDVGGPQGSPAYTLQGGYAIRLAGGDPSSTPFEESSSGGVAVSTANSGCKLCYDGADQSGQPGQWSLHFSTGQSPATYSVHVVVSY